MSEAYKRDKAAAYLDLEDARTLLKLPIPRSDVRVEGSKRAALRWQKDHLDAFLEASRIKAGHEGLD